MDSVGTKKPRIVWEGAYIHPGKGQFWGRGISRPTVNIENVRCVVDILKFIQ